MALLMAATLPGARGIAWAFSAPGHLVVGHVAEMHLCAAAQAEFTALLDGQSLGEAGLWLDRVRGVERWRHTRSWHYIDVADGRSLARAASRRGEHVYAAYRRHEAELDDRTLPDARRATALRVVVHLAADLHQPLHVGRPGDRGGNDIRVRVRGEPQALSLHALWDGALLLYRENLPMDALARSIAPLATGQVATWQGDDPLTWGRESMAFRPLVYSWPDGRRDGDFLGPDYLGAARNVIALRLAQAGVRLAGRLNRIAGCRPGEAPLQ